MNGCGYGARPTQKGSVARMAPVREVSGEGIRMREGRGYRQERVSLVKLYGTVNVLKHSS